jgi:hypothetical protein
MGLTAMSHTGSGCPPKERLLLFVVRILALREQKDVGSHLESCASCHALAEEFARLDDLMDEWSVAMPTRSGLDYE